MTDAEFETIIQTAANAAPESHTFGGRKVFIHRVYEGAKMMSPTIAAMSLDDFKRRLLKLNRTSRTLELARADFVAAMSPSDVEKSMTHDSGATYNFVVRGGSALPAFGGRPAVAMVNTGSAAKPSAPSRARASSPKAKAPRAPKATSKPAAAPAGPIDDAEFEAVVKTATNAAPASHRFGDRKVFIHRVYEGAKMASPAVAAMSLDDFKRQLLKLNRTSRWLELARADLVAALDPSDVEKSMTHDNGSTYNYVIKH